MEGYKIIIPGRPIAKERPRQGKYGVYTPRRTKQFENKVRIEATKQVDEILSGRLGIKIKFYIHGGRLPDIDNLTKSVLDGLIVKRVPKFGMAGIIEDDNIIEKISAERIIVLSKREERTEIYIYPRGAVNMAG
ncbi:Holliday junction DNA helicase [Carboxydothermus islandicus]|uniref:Holliday junction DNA helicase n=1 Tax=Carboxydothermus islandicus TaxID=661089 RepID=A0A1L8D0X4_9THEO|nr:RusA family crossover junction endodeoxyribonuclease [Carboxydothermus islandicus]GAV24789.1 Holliday junction DNA helicase [Carboxydothermus islandicus]